MNVLIYVMTMLMVLALISYARLETYRNSQIFQILFAHYMEKDERGFVNKGFEAQYNSTTGKIKEGEKKNKPKISASPRISLSLFLNKEKQSAESAKFQQSALLLKNLLQVLYGTQPFYEALVKERPHFNDELIAAMISAIDVLPAEKKPKKTSDLSNLVLPDPVLNEALYKILHGAPEKYEEPELKAPETQQADTIEDSSQDADLLAAETEEHSSPKGYVSLADFITFTSSPQIRIYLASPQVLQAIFHNPQLVQEVLEMRKELHRQILGNGNAKELEEAFKSRFIQQRDPALDSELLNFQVSKTDPRKYE